MQSEILDQQQRLSRRIWKAGRMDYLGRISLCERAKLSRLRVLVGDRCEMSDSFGTRRHFGGGHSTVRSSSMLLSRPSRTRIELHSAIHDDGDDDESAAESHTHLLPPQNFLMLVLFPRILIIREDDDEELVFGETAFRNRKAATAAQELREDLDARRPKRDTSRREKK
jgi:hypothetical protein